MENLTDKQKVLEIVKSIPKGKISSYGRIANITGISPRVVGFILSGITKEEMQEIPWHRVVDRNGFISSSKLGEKGVLQEQMLKAEGVEIEKFQILKPERYWIN